MSAVAPAVTSSVRSRPGSRRASAQGLEDERTRQRDVSGGVDGSKTQYTFDGTKYVSKGLVQGEFTKTNNEAADKPGLTVLAAQLDASFEKLAADKVMIKSCKTLQLGRAAAADWVVNTIVLFPKQASCKGSCCGLELGDSDSPGDVGVIATKVCFTNGKVTAPDELQRPSIVRKLYTEGLHAPPSAYVVVTKRPSCDGPGAVPVWHTTSMRDRALRISVRATRISA